MSLSAICSTHYEHHKYTCSIHQPAAGTMPKGSCGGAAGTNGDSKSTAGDSSI